MAGSAHDTPASRPHFTPSVLTNIKTWRAGRKIVHVSYYPPKVMILGCAKWIEVLAQDATVQERSLCQIDGKQSTLQVEKQHALTAGSKGNCKRCIDCAREGRALMNTRFPPCHLGLRVFKRAVELTEAQVEFEARAQSWIFCSMKKQACPNILSNEQMSME